MWIGNVDYTSGSYTVIFFAGMTTALLNISIIDDDILENDEIFYLTIYQDSLPTNVSTGSSDQTTVIIVDDDRECFEIQ